MSEKKAYRDKYSREIAFPVEIAEMYKEYCRVTKLKISDPLRVMVLDSLPQLHNTKNLGEIIAKTKNRDMNDKYEKLHVRLPNEAVDEVNTFCKFFKLNWKRCHFLYFLIEEKLLQTIKDVLKDE